MHLCVAAARRVALIVCALALAGGMLAAPASAKVDVTGFLAKPIPAGATCSTTTSAPTESQAGANKDFCVAMAFNGYGDNFGGGDDVQDLRMSLPQGQVGGATATPTCSVEQFKRSSGCPASSQVGEASGRIETVLTLPETLISGKIFNLTPVGSEAARLGVQLELAGLAPLQKVQAVILLRADGGLDALSVGLPRTFLGLQIEIRKFNLKLWGSTADHPSMAEPFVVNPTDCSKPATTTVSVQTFQGSEGTGAASYQPTGCDQLQFSPSMILEGDHAADGPGTITAGLTFPAAGTNGLAQARVKTADVVLPQGYELSAAAGSEPGFVGCTDEQFAQAVAAPTQCPAGSKVGTVRFKSPLIADELEGTVYLAAQRPGAGLIRIFVYAETGPDPEAARVKLGGEVIPDQQTGQLTTRLTNLPPVPFTMFRLSFRGGPTAIISGPRTCGTRTGSTSVVPDSGGPAATVAAPITVDTGCGDPARFAPGLATSLTTAQAAWPTALTATIIRPDGNARLTGANLSLPPGFSGRLTAADQCPVAAARTGGCGPANRVGAVRVRVGAGPVPAPIDGNVYLTTPQAPGDLAGLAIVVPGQFGPLYFGDLIVMARIVVRPDIGLDIYVTDVPQRVYGIDINLREMSLTLDRPGFGLNATSCAPMAITGTLFSDLGATAAVSAPYQATGCENVVYTPTLGAKLTGGRKEVDENGHPELQTTVGAGLGQGGTKGLELILPEGLSIDVDRIKRSCPIADYQAGTCKDEAVVGSAVAASPLINEPLQGNVTFVSIPGVPLPELRIDLRGPLSITVSGAVSQRGKRLVAAVTGLPDTPLTRFSLTLAGGSRGLLQASEDLCASRKLPLDVDFSSFSGATAKRTVSAEIPDCSPAGTLKVSSLRGGRPALDLRVVGGRTRMTTTQLILPRGVEFARASIVKKRLRVSAAGLKKRSRAKVTVTGHTIKVTVPKGQSARILRVRLARGSVRVSKRLRKLGRPRLTFRLRSSLQDGRRPSLRVRARPAATPQGR